MIIYGLKSCDTCRKARKAFAQAAFIDVSADPVPVDVLGQAEAAFGAELVNRRSTTWRGLSDTERAMTTVELIQAHPKVMKRPLISVDNQFFLGWTKEIERELGVILQP